MPNTTPTPDDPGSATPGAVWVSAREAAAALGVSEKTVLRRVKANKLTGRKVAGDSGGLVWEVSLKPNGQRPDKETISKDILTGQTEILKGHSGRTNRDSERTSDRIKADSERTKADFERDLTGQSERTPTGQPDNLKGHLTGQTEILKGQNSDTGARFMAHLETENAFLRATIEQLQRDGAEVRAALRAALKLAAPQSPPQLTTGEGAPASIAAQQAPQNGVANIHSPKAAKGRETPATARKKPLTYGDIADEIERDLKARGL